MEPPLAAVDKRTDEKQTTAVARHSESGEGVATTDIATAVVKRDEYPTGIRLILIITALCLAIFLASLDMVRMMFTSNHEQSTKPSIYAQINSTH
jgi:hypothetical protein